MDDLGDKAGSAGDKKALLNELRIDRAAPSRRSRPLAWFAAIALLGGLGFVAWAVGVPLLDRGPVEVRTVVARAPAASAAGDSVLDATGYVVARRQATVSSKTTGKVLEVLIEEGNTVAEGQLLAILDDSIPRARLDLAESRIGAARAALAEIRVNIRQAELDVERTARLTAKNLASKADLDRDRLALEALEARLERSSSDIEVAERSLAVERRQLVDMEIRAPFAGVVIAKAAQPGEMISPVSAGGGFTRTGICTIVDMDSLEVEVDVNEAYINRVYPDQPVTVALNAYPDEAMPASVIATIPAADRNKATVRVRIRFLEPSAKVLPDMGVKVAFLEQATERAVAEQAAPAGVLVPRAAVGGEGAARFVWVVRDATATRRAVRVGDAKGSVLRVEHGLDAGERVVAALTDELQGALSDGARVQVAR